MCVRIWYNLKNAKNACKRTLDWFYGAVAVLFTQLYVSEVSTLTKIECKRPGMKLLRQWQGTLKEMIRE